VRWSRASCGASRADLAQLPAAIAAALRSVQASGHARRAGGSDGSETLRLAIDVAPGTPVEARVRIARELSVWLRTRGEIASVVAEIRTRSVPISPDPFGSAIELRIRLRPQSTWAHGRTPALVEQDIRGHVAALPGLSLRVRLARGTCTTRAVATDRDRDRPAPSSTAGESRRQARNRFSRRRPASWPFRWAGVDRVPRFVVNVKPRRWSRAQDSTSVMSSSPSPRRFGGITVSTLVDGIGASTSPSESDSAPRSPVLR